MTGINIHNSIKLNISTQRAKIEAMGEDCIIVTCPVLHELCKFRNKEMLDKNAKCRECRKLREFQEQRDFEAHKPVVKECSGEIDTMFGKAKAKQIIKTENGYKMRIDCPKGFGDCVWDCTDIDNKGRFLCPYCKKIVSKTGIEILEENAKRQALNRPARKDIHNAKTWNKLRYMVLKRDGGKCCLCGRGASDGVKLHIDHIKPASLYPELYYDPNNLQTLCDECNYGKSDGDSTDWRK